jgi:hypothetical protein
MISLMPPALCCIVLLLVFFVGHVAAVPCPHCHGNFGSCAWSAANPVCPAVAVVSTNAKVMAAGAGAIVVSTLIKPRFLRAFTKATLDSLVSLIKRPAPGTPFVIDAAMTGTALLSACRYGQTTVESALFGLSDLIDQETDADELAKLKQKVEMLKTLGSLKGLMSEANPIVDMGIYSYVWAKVSEFVVKRPSSASGALDSSASTQTSVFQAKTFRPENESQFSRQMNLFGMFVHALGVVSFLVLADFYEHVVHDTVGLRGETWQLAHELMLILFRRVEDSGGSLTLGTVFNESYLNTHMSEARRNVTLFFRPHGGNPGETDDVVSGIEQRRMPNGKSTASADKVCAAFNFKNRRHSQSDLLADGTCRHRHACNHWVSNKGSNGRCLGDHPNFQCTNPAKVDQPVA